MPRRATHREGLEEKGQRTTRSTDTYLAKEAPKAPVFCRKCGLFYRNKRWVMDSGEFQKMKSGTGVATTVCPACQRIADDNPAGVVTLSGDYLLSHEDEILNALKHTELQSRTKNPLGRIMEIAQEADVVTITTTEDKLAQKLGREIFKAHRGELQYQWSHDPQLVRVTWKR